MTMRWYGRLLLVAGLAALLPYSSRAASNDVQFTADTNLQIPDSGVIIVAVSGGNVASLAVNAGTIDVGLESGSNITLRSDDKRTLTVTPAIATYVCGSSNSYISLESTITRTVTVSIGAVCSASSSSSSSSSGGGGGGGQVGGGGGGLTIPRGVAVTINGGAALTATENVTLTLEGVDANLMQVSNSATFTDVTSWAPFAKTLAWTLVPGPGVKTVFAKFRSSVGGESAVVTDAITLQPGAVLAPSPTPVPVVAPVPTTGPAGEGELVQEAGKPAVYRIENGRRRVFRNGNVFLAHGFAWSAVRSARSLAAIPLGDPMDYPVRAGMLVKGRGPKVYLIEGGSRRWVATEAVFIGLGYQWSAIRVLSDTTLGGIPEGSTLSQAASHPDGSLIKYAKDANVYLLEGGKKRWIPSAAVFVQRGFRWGDVLTIPATFTYPNGPDVTAAVPSAPPSVPVPPTTGTVLGTAYEPVFTADLALGSRGEQVATLQKFLIVRGFFPNNIVPSGTYGPTTVAAVRRFQQAYGLPATGTVGLRTREALHQLAGQ